MKTITTLLTAALMLGVSAATAQNSTATPPPAAQTAEKPAAAFFTARAEMHRAMAVLMDARAAEKPDPAEIAKLVQRVRTLRAQIAAQSPGPRTGYAQGGPGRGYGRGAAYGPGRGYGRGGYGQGRGRGYGPGGGCGMGLGPWFIDENADGVCDRLQTPVTK